MRAFIAMDITDEVRRRLPRVQQELGAAPAKVKWVPPGNLHVTMKFLGDVDEETVERVKAAMAEAAADDGPIEFDVHGIGAFPPRGRPRVVWAGVSRGGEAIGRLHDRLERALRPLGVKRDRRFSPHITIGRVKSSRGARELSELIESRPEQTYGTCPGAELVLYKSTLTPQGAEYEAVARQRLGE